MCANSCLASCSVIVLMAGSVESRHSAAMVYSI